MSITGIPAIKIANLPISLLSKRVFVDEVTECLSSEYSSPVRIVTANPEFAVLASTNPEFFKAIVCAHVQIADGVGLLIASKFLELKKNFKTNLLSMVSIFPFLWLYATLLFIVGKVGTFPIKEKITGVDLIDDLCARAVGEDWRICFIGGWDGVGERAAEFLSNKYPGLTIKSFSGSPNVARETSTEWLALLSQIKEFSPTIIFVAYGFPQQEYWIARHLENLPGKLVVGVGGALDMIAGQLKRAPLSLQRLGLEWLWRFFLQPTRWRRIFRALVVFPLLIFKQVNYSPTVNS